MLRLIWSALVLSRLDYGNAVCWWDYQPTCTTACSRYSMCCSIDHRSATLWSHHQHTRQFPLVESPGACSVQAGDNRLSFAERHGAAKSGCRPATFVTLTCCPDDVCGITYSSARCPPVAVCYCWRPNLRCRRCSTMEQSATRHCHEWHFATVPART